MTSIAPEVHSGPALSGPVRPNTFMRRKLSTAGGLLFIALLVGISYQAGRQADLRRGLRDALIARELIYLPSINTARLMSLGFEQLVADWYWVRALQYFVEPANELNRYRNLADILDVVVGVDPDFEYAYKFGGIATPYDTGRLRFANTDQAISFLERGTARFPNNWQMRLYLGFYLLNFKGDSTRAAEQFALAAPLPGAPQYLKRFAARLFSVSGDVERARTFTEQMLAITEDPAERVRLEGRLEDIELERRFREVERAAEQFRAAQGRWPVGLGELATFHPLPALPKGAELENGTLRAPSVERLVVHEHPIEAPMRAAQ